MGFLKRFGLSKAKADGSLDLNDLASELVIPEKDTGHEKRAYKRFSLGLPLIVQVDFGDGNPVPIRDLSYGGFVADIDFVPTQSRKPEGMQARLLALSSTCAATVGYVYSRGNAVAFRIHHNSSDCLMFLREPLEALRLGSTLTPISGDMLKAPYNQAGWICLRGDGPTDLIVSTTSSDRILEATMTFRNGETYNEVSLKGDVIKTSRTIDTTGQSAARMSQTEILDVQSLKTAIYILSGIADKGTKKLTDQFFQMIYEVYLKAKRASGDQAS